MSYCCCYGLASNLQNIFSNKTFKKLANMTTLCLDHMTPQNSVLIPHENHTPGFFPWTLMTQDILQKQGKHLDWDCVLKFEALTQVVGREDTYLCHKQ